MKKPRLLLLDADVIVFANQYGVWSHLKGSYEVCVPATVIEEAKFFVALNTAKSIDLREEEEAGQIHRMEAESWQIRETFANFDDSFLVALQDGEKEGITILKANADSGLVFCTGDTAAIQAVGMLGLGGICVSFEKALELAGLLKHVKSLFPHLTERSHCVHVNKGRERRVTGECFKKNPLEL